MDEITADEKRFIRLSEEYRAEIASSLAKEKRPSWVNENTKWILATIVIPLSIAVHKGFETARSAETQRQETQRARTAEAEQTERVRIQQNASAARNNSQLLVAMLDIFSDPDKPERQQMAFSVLAYLQDKAELPGELVAMFKQTAGLLVTRLSNGKQTPSDVAVLKSAALAFAEGPSSKERIDFLNAAARAVDSEQSLKNTAQLNPATAVQLPPRVYIQIYREKDRALMQRVVSALTVEKILSPGIDNVVASAAKKGAKAPVAHKVPTIIYFRAAEVDIANRVAEIATKASGLKFVTLAALEQVGKTRAGHIELWIPDT